MSATGDSAPVPGSAQVSETDVAGGGSAAGGGGGGGSDFAAMATHKIEDVVGIVRDRTVRPVATAVRYFLVALLGLTIGILVLVLVAVAGLRILDTEVPVFRTRVWASYLVLAGIFWIAGMLLSRMRRSRR